MKGDKMLKLIGQIDDALIEEAIRPAPAKKKSRRAFWAVPIAAVLVLSLTVGAGATGVFGRIFEQYTGKTGKDVPPGINEKVIENAVLLPRSSSVLENEDSANLLEQDIIQLSLTEYSSDGMTVSLGFSLLCKDEILNEKYTTFFPARFGPQDSETYEIWVNGEKIDGTMYYSNVPFFEATNTPGTYTGIVTFLLPESLQGAEELSVHYKFSKLEAQSFPPEAKEDITKRTEEAVEYCSLDVNLEDTAVVYAHAAIQRYTPNAEFGGVVLSEVELGTSIMKCRFIVPAEMDFRSILRPLDEYGEVVSPYDGTSETAYLEDGKKVVTILWSAPEGNPSALTFRIVDWEHDPDLIVGEYILSLQ